MSFDPNVQKDLSQNFDHFTGYKSREGKVDHTETIHVYVEKTPTTEKTRLSRGAINELVKIVYDKTKDKAGASSESIIFIHPESDHYEITHKGSAVQRGKLSELTLAADRSFTIITSQDPGILQIPKNAKDSVVASTPVSSFFRPILDKLAKIAEFLGLRSPREKKEEYSVDYKVLQEVIGAFPSDGTVSLLQVLEYHLKIMEKYDITNKPELRVVLSNCVAFSKQLEKQQAFLATFKEKIVAEKEKAILAVSAKATVKKLSQEDILKAFQEIDEKYTQQYEGKKREILQQLSEEITKRLHQGSYTLLAVPLENNREGLIEIAASKEPHRFTITLLSEAKEDGTVVSRKHTFEDLLFGETAQFVDALVLSHLEAAPMQIDPQTLETRFGKKATESTVKKSGFGAAKTAEAYLKTHSEDPTMKATRLKSEVDDFLLMYTKDDTWLSNPKHRDNVKGSIEKIIYEVKKNRGVYFGPNKDYQNQKILELEERLSPLYEYVVNYENKTAFASFDTLTNVTADFKGDSINRKIELVGARSVHGSQKNPAVISNYSIAEAKALQQQLNGDAEANKKIMHQWSSILRVHEEKKEWELLDSAVMQIGSSLYANGRDPVAHLQTSEEKEAFYALASQMAKGVSDAPFMLFDRAICMTQLLDSVNQLSGSDVALPPLADHPYTAYLPKEALSQLSVLATRQMAQKNEAANKPTVEAIKELQNTLDDLLRKERWMDIPTDSKLQRPCREESGPNNSQNICSVATSSRERDLRLMQIGGSGKISATIAAFLASPNRFNDIKLQQLFLQNMMSVKTTLERENPSPSRETSYLSELNAVNPLFVHQLIEKITVQYNIAQDAKNPQTMMFMAKMLHLMKSELGDKLVVSEKIANHPAFKEPLSAIVSIHDGFNFEKKRDLQSLIAREGLFCYYHEMQNRPDFLEKVSPKELESIMKLHFSLAKVPIQNPNYQSPVQDDAHFRLIQALTTKIDALDGPTKDHMVYSLLPEALLADLGKQKCDYSKFPVCVVGNVQIDLVKGLLFIDGKAREQLPKDLQRTPPITDVFKNPNLMCSLSHTLEAPDRVLSIYTPDSPKGFQIQVRTRFDESGNSSAPKITILQQQEQKWFQYVDAPFNFKSGELAAIFGSNDRWINVNDPNECILTAPQTDKIKYRVTLEKDPETQAVYPKKVTNDAGSTLLNREGLPAELREAIDHLKLLGEPMLLWGTEKSLEKIEYVFGDSSFSYTVGKNTAGAIELRDKEGWVLQNPGRKPPQELYRQQEEAIDKNFFNYCHVLQNKEGKYKVLLPARELVKTAPEDRPKKFEKWLETRYYTKELQKKGEPFYQLSFDTVGRIKGDTIESNLALAYFFTATGKYASAVEILQKNCKTSAATGYSEREQAILNSIIASEGTDPHLVALKLHSSLLLGKSSKEEMGPLSEKMGPIFTAYQEKLENIGPALRLSSTEIENVCDILSQSSNNEMQLKSKMEKAEKYLKANPVREKGAPLTIAVRESPVIGTKATACIAREEVAFDREKSKEKSKKLFTPKEGEDPAVVKTLQTQREATNDYIDQQKVYTYSLIPPSQPSDADPFQKTVQSLTKERDIASKESGKLRERILLEVNGPLQPLQKLQHVTQGLPEWTIEQLLGLYIQGRLDEAVPQGADAKKIETELKQYLVKSIQMQQLDSCISKAKVVEGDRGNQEKLEALYEVMEEKRAYDPDTHPYAPVFLLIEYCNGFIIRKNNIDTIEKLISKPNSVQQLIMGAGKTKTILPIIAKTHADGTVLSIIILPEEMYGNTIKDLDATSRPYFRQDIYRLLFSRESIKNMTVEDLNSIYVDLAEVIESKGCMATTRPSMMALRHAVTTKLESASHETKEQAKLLDEVRALAKIIDLVKSRGVGLTDEIHSILDVRKEVNFSVGDQSKLNETKQKIGAALFEKLLTSDNTDVRKLLQSLLANEQSKLDPEIKKRALQSFAETFYDQSLEKHISKELFVQYVTEGVLDADLVGEDGIPDFMHKVSKEHYTQIAFLKSFLKDGLPSVLDESNNVGYGRSEDGVNVIPFSGANQASEGSEFDEESKRICAFYVDYLQTGINQKQLEQYISQEIFQAYQELQELKKSDTPSVSVNDTKAGMRFKEPFHSNLSDFKEENIPFLLHTFNEDSSRKIKYCRDHVLNGVKKNTNQCKGNSQDLPEMLLEMGGVSGTTPNAKSYNKKIDCTDAQKPEIYGQIFATLLGKAIEPKVHSIRATDGKTTMDAMLDDPEVGLQSGRLVYVDGGCFSKGVMSGEQAKRMVDKIRDNQKGTAEPIKAVVFVNEENLIVAHMIGSGAIVPFAELSSLGVKLDERLSFYDDVHKQGMDITQSKTVKGVMTYREGMFLRNLAQEIYRLREVGKAQTFDYAIDAAAKPLIAPEKKEAEALTQDDILYYATKAESLAIAHDTYRGFRDKIGRTVPNLYFDTLIEKALDPTWNNADLLGLFNVAEPSLVTRQTEENELKSVAQVCSFNKDVPKVLEGLKESEQKKIDRQAEQPLQENIQQAVQAIAAKTKEQLALVIIPKAEDLPTEVDAKANTALDISSTTQTETDINVLAEAETQTLNLSLQLTEVDIQVRIEVTSSEGSRFEIDRPSEPFGQMQFSTLFAPINAESVLSAPINTESAWNSKLDGLRRGTENPMILPAKNGFYVTGYFRNAKPFEGSYRPCFSNSSNILVTSNWDSIGLTGVRGSYVNPQEYPQLHKPVALVAFIEDTETGEKRALIIDQTDLDTLITPLSNQDERYKCNVFDMRTQGGQPLWIMGSKGEAPPVWTQDGIEQVKEKTFFDDKFLDLFVETKLMAGNFEMTLQELKVTEKLLTNRGKEEVSKQAFMAYESVESGIRRDIKFVQDIIAEHHPQIEDQLKELILKKTHPLATNMLKTMGEKMKLDETQTYLFFLGIKDSRIKSLHEAMDMNLDELHSVSDSLKVAKNRYTLYREMSKGQEQLLMNNRDVWDHEHPEARTEEILAGKHQELRDQALYIAYMVRSKEKEVASLGQEKFKEFYKYNIKKKLYSDEIHKAENGSVYATFLKETVRTR